MGIFTPRTVISETRSAMPDSVVGSFSRIFQVASMAQEPATSGLDALYYCC